MSLIRLIKDLEALQSPAFLALNAKFPDPMLSMADKWRSPMLKTMEANEKMIKKAFGPIAESLKFHEQLSQLTHVQQQIKSMIGPTLQAAVDWQTKTLNLIAPSFEPIIGQLAGESRYIGTFDVAEFEQADELTSDGSEASEIIIPRLLVVNNLPIRVMRAILANPHLLHGIDPFDFEKVVAELLSAQGFQNIQVTPRSGDGGRDILATQFVAGIPVFFCFECKRYEDKVGVGVMRSLLGAVMAKSSKVNKGVLVTTSTFTKGAKLMIAEETMVSGKDFNDLVKWIGDYRQSNS